MTFSGRYGRWGRLKTREACECDARLQPRHPHPAAYLARYLPDLIKGDLDSLRSDVREYYTSKVSVLRSRGCIPFVGVTPEHSVTSKTKILSRYPILC